jgi:hypothetical protein
MVMDQANNLYIVLNFGGTVDFDPGPGVYNLTASENDMGICKLDSSGQFLWAGRISTGGPKIVQPHGIHADSSGVYITGEFNETVDFDPGPSNGYLYGGQLFSTASFLLKLDTAGSFVWAAGWGANAGSWGEDLITDGDGNIYVVGRFQGSVDFDPGPGTHMLSMGVETQPDGYILKLDSNAGFVWVRQLRSRFTSPAKWEEAEAIDIDSDGDLVVGGEYHGRIYIDTTQFLEGPGGESIFICGLDTAGNLEWASGFGGNGKEQLGSIACQSDGDMTFCGSFEKTSDFDPDSASSFTMTAVGGYDGFTCRLDSTGGFVWAKQIGGLKAEHCLSVVVDAAGYSYVNGYFEGTVDFDPQASYFHLSSNGSNDGFVMLLTPEGNVVWAKQVGGPKNDAITSVSLTGDSTLYYVGYYRDTADLDPGAAVLSFVSLYAEDVLISALRPCVYTSDTISLIACDSLLVNGEVILQSGIYKQAIATTFGCDSMLTVIASIGYSDTTISAISCGPYELNGQTYDSSGTYVQHLPSSLPCDSIITLNLIVGNAEYVTHALAACTMYTSPSGHHIWTTSGTYFDTIQTVLGCDSFMTIHLTVGNNSASSMTVTTCDSYVSPSGQLLDTSGIYHDTILNSHGCDSIITLDLIVNGSSAAVIDTTVCTNFVSPGGHIWTSSGTYLDTITNTSGCDSVLTVNLTVADSYGSFTHTACIHFISPSESFEWTQSGIYNDTIQNVVGCDSFLTVHLTIIPVNTDVIQSGNILISTAVGASSYQWLDCSAGFVAITGATAQLFTAIANGSYAVLVSENGCSDTSSCYDVTGLYSPGMNCSPEIQLYPNPTTDGITISLPTTWHNMTVQIRDILGGHMRQLSVDPAGTLALELPETAAVYSVIITDNSGRNHCFMILKH